MAAGETARDREGPRERGTRRKEDGPAHSAETLGGEAGRKERRRRTRPDVGPRPVAEGPPRKKRRLPAGSGTTAAKRTGADDRAVGARAERRSGDRAGQRAAAAGRDRAGDGACASTKKLNAANAWADQYISGAQEDSEGEVCDGDGGDPGIAEGGADDSDVWMDEEDLPELTVGRTEEETASVDAVKKMAEEIKTIGDWLRDNSSGKLWSRRPGPTTVVVTPRAAAMLKQLGENFNRFRACCSRLWPDSKTLLRDMFFDVILKNAVCNPNLPVPELYLTRFLREGVRRVLSVAAAVERRLEGPPAPAAEAASAAPSHADETFRAHYMTRLTQAFGNELERVRTESGKQLDDPHALGMFIHSLQAGVLAYDDGERERWQG